MVTGFIYRSGSNPRYSVQIGAKGCEVAPSVRRRAAGERASRSIRNDEKWAGLALGGESPEHIELAFHESPPVTIVETAHPTPAHAAAEKMIAKRQPFPLFVIALVRAIPVNGTLRIKRQLQHPQDGRRR